MPFRDPSLHKKDYKKWFVKKVSIPVSVGGGGANSGDESVESVSGVAVTTAESLSS